MESIFYAADAVYTLLFLVAGVLAALEPQRDHLRATRRLVVIGSIIVAVRWSAWAFTTEAAWPVRRVVGGLIGAALLVLVPGVLHWLAARQPPEAQPQTQSVAPAVAPPPPSVAPPPAQQAKPEPTGIYKYIADGLVKARTDLLSIKKSDLSCENLSAWQARADTTTRLAHANGIGIHNPISQHVGACRNITDPDLLDAIRTSIVQLLDQGIEATKGR